MTAELQSKLHSLRLDRQQRPEHEHRRRPWLGTVLAVVVASAVSAAVAWHYRPNPTASAGAFPAPSASAPASITPVPAVSTPQTLVASGYVVARRRATVAAEVTARLVDVRVDEGQRVEKGQLLALLDDVPIVADLQTAQSKVSSAKEAISIVQSDLTEAARILARSQDLVGKGFISKADLTRDEARLKNLDAQLRKSRADLVTALAQATGVQKQVAKYRIHAPFSGIVIDKSAQAGEIVSPVSAGGGFTRTGICTIVDMESLEIHADVNEAFIGRVHVGQVVEAVLDAYPDVTLRAHVVAIIPTANRDKATVRVRIGFDAYDARILPDMGAKVKLADRT